jgi:hypothetical protein
MSDQATSNAHLRPLPRCACGKPAVQELRNGLNAVIGVYCSQHASAALKRFKKQASP